MKRLLILTFVILFSSQLSLSQITDNSKIYILSCSPGDELYQAFGHTAFWIKDDSTRLNYIYHYGTFNYSDPNFYTNFIKGRLDYMLGLESHQMFMQEYADDGRDVYKLELNLTCDQKVEMYNFLTWKSQTENKYYKYDFFEDNCATRVVGVLDTIYGSKLIYPEININFTYRESIKPYLQAKPWMRFGINLVLGMPADEKLDIYSAMYLPDYIDSVFTKAKIITNSGEENLGIDRTYLIQSDYKIGERPFFNPTYLFWLIFVLFGLLFFFEVKKQKKFKGIDFTLLFITGLIGIVLLFMWFGTEHTPTKWNLNILWAFPTNIIVAFMIFKQKRDLFVKKYLFVISILNIILAITMWFLLPQQYDTATFPIILILILRLGGYLMKPF
jgi:Domain of unknown function (DUF4105)